MKQLKRIISKWYFQLLLVLIPFVLGFVGYRAFYAQTQIRLPTLYAFYSTIRLFTFVFDLGNQEAQPWIRIVLEIARALAIIPTGHVIFRLIRPFLSRFLVKLRFYRWSRREDQVLLVGNNAENRTIYSSVPAEKGCLLLAETLDECDALSTEGIAAVTASAAAPKSVPLAASTSPERLLVRLIERTVNSDKKHCTVILNAQDDEQNLLLCKAAAAAVSKLLGPEQANLSDAALPAAQRRAAEQRLASVLNRLRIVVFGSREYQAVYLDLQGASFGVLKYLNKYQLVAFDFVTRYPFTEFMDEAAWRRDIHNACLDPAVDLNMLLIGFGEINQELYTASFAINQYVSECPGQIPAFKQISYHIFDKDMVRYNKNLNHTVLRYEKDFLDAIKEGSLKQEDYFNLPAVPADTSFYQTDVNDIRFYRTLQQILRANPRSVNYIVIAVGSDLENMDVAQRLLEKKVEWQLDNVQIFARVRSTSSEEIRASAALKGYISFGNEQQLVYRFDRILRNDTEELAIERNIMYEHERLRKEGVSMPLDAVVSHAVCSWYTMENLKRLSNLYGILSLRMKLQLLGLDHRRTGAAPHPLPDNEAYFACYAGSQRPEVLRHGGPEGKDIYAYDHLPMLEDFTADETRSNLAVQEHYRWNAFMIANGFVPEKKSVVLSQLPRNYHTRTHGNLTDFTGLFAFRRELAAATGRTEDACDVIRYDYQLMDDAWWFLHAHGRDIFPRYPAADSEE